MDVNKQATEDRDNLPGLIVKEKAYFYEYSN